MRSDADPTPWSTGRAMIYGAIIGAAAAAFKLLAPDSLGLWHATHGIAAMTREMVGAALAFALLCGIAAAVRNFAVGRLTGPKAR